MSSKIITTNMVHGVEQPLVYIKEFNAYKAAGMEKRFEKQFK